MDLRQPETPRPCHQKLCLSPLVPDCNISGDQRDRLQPAGIPRDANRVQTIPRAELPDRVGEIVAHRCGGEVETLADLLRRQPRLRRAQYVRLTLRERTRARLDGRGDELRIENAPPRRY